MNGTSTSDEIHTYSTADCISTSYVTGNLNALVSTSTASLPSASNPNPVDAVAQLVETPQEIHLPVKSQVETTKPTALPKKPRAKAKPVKLTPSISPSATLIEPPIGKGPFRCTVCNKEFLKWPQFRRHKTEHLDEKSFKCRLCPMTFNFEINFQLHCMVHEAEKDGVLQCQVCPAKFSRLASLKSHLRAHEKDENLVCQECGDEFQTQARLESHMGKPFLVYTT